MASDRSTRDIKSNRLFTGVKENVLSTFFDPKEVLEAREGEIIYKTGDQSTSIYLIIKGEAKVKFPSNNYLATKIHNDFFGEKELVEETKRVSSAMAFSRLIYYKLNKNSFNKLLKKNPVIEENLKTFGEFKLPESSSDNEKKFNISKRDKPLAFRLFGKNKDEEETITEDTSPTVQTQQLLPDFESIDKSLEDEVITSSELNFDLEKSFEDLQDKEFDEIEEIPDTIEEAPIAHEELQEEFSNTSNTQTEANEQAEQVVVKENKKQSAEIEIGINREIIRRIFLALHRIYSGISINELVKNTKRALKDLTNSESADLVFIEEKNSTMYKMTTHENNTKNEYFDLKQGLTGYCATQKYPINYDRPTEDVHFNPSIDYPGSSRMKRILYFPIINDSGETVAVLQTARDNLKFSEDEIWCLTMISKQMETAINKAKILEQMLSREKLSSGKKLSEIITKEIHIPIDIIDSYVRILNSKNLPSEVDDLIRMVQKHAASIVVLTDSILKVLIDEIVLSNAKIHFNEFVDDILELLSEYCETQELKLFKKIGDGGVVEIDRSKLYTAILQFIKASVADSRKGDRIYFSSELIDNSISIIIQNEGKGIIVLPEGEILDYFYSNEKIKDDEVHLLLAKKIISAHSGFVEVESIKGVGSTIKIKLPVAQ